MGKLLPLAVFIFVNLQAQVDPARLEIELRRKGIPVTVDSPLPPPVRIELLRIQEFHIAYDTFDRKLRGCPPTGYGPCSPVTGQWDAKLWERVCKLADKAFQRNYAGNKRRGTARAH